MPTVTIHVAAAVAVIMLGVTSPPQAVARSIPCDPAPSAIVDLINASFTNGERLTDAQSVTGIKDMMCPGDNIEFANGVRVPVPMYGWCSTGPCSPCPVMRGAEPYCPSGATSLQRATSTGRPCRSVWGRRRAIG